MSWADVSLLDFCLALTISTCRSAGWGLGDNNIYYLSPRVELLSWQWASAHYGRSLRHCQCVSDKISNLFSSGTCEMFVVWVSVLKRRKINGACRRRSAEMKLSKKETKQKPKKGRELWSALVYVLYDPVPSEVTPGHICSRSADSQWEKWSSLTDRRSRANGRRG